MSQTIDNRIVEMQFENKQFESGVKESLSTLDKLKKALNFEESSKNLLDFSKSTKNFSLNDIGENVEKVSDKFSAFGVVGFTVMQRLTNAALDLGHKISETLTMPITLAKQGGWKRAMNIEEAKFQLEGLGLAWEDVSDDIDYAVSGTAYGLDAAAKAAAQLSASGVQAGDALKAALRGISGVAAMGNTEYENIAQIFTKAAGNNRVMADELNRISQYGLNASATLADFFNNIEENTEVPEHLKAKILDLTEGLKVTEADIRDFASHSQIDFETFSYAMDQAFGEHAKDANKTFFGALSNIKAALSRIGAEFATPFIQNAIPVLNAVRELINEIKKNMTRVFQIFAGLTEAISGALTDKIYSIMYFIQDNASVSIKLGSALRNIIEAIIRVVAALRGAFQEVFPPTDHFGTAIENIASGIEKFSEKLILSDDALIGFKNIMVIVFRILKAATSIIKVVLNLVGKGLSIIFRIISAIANVIVNVGRLVSQLNLVEIALNGIRFVGGVFIVIFEKIVNAIRLFKEELNNTDSVIGKFASKVKDVASIIAGSIIGVIYLAFIKIKSLIDNIRSGNFLNNIITNLKKIADLLKNIPVIKNVISFLEKGFTTIKNLLSEIKGSGNIATFILDKIKIAASNFKLMMADATNVTGQFLLKIRDLAFILAGSVYVAFNKLISIFNGLRSGDPLGYIVNSFKNLISNLKELNLAEKIASNFSNIFKNLSSIFDKLILKFNEIKNRIKSLFSTAEEGEKVIETVVEKPMYYADNTITVVAHTLTKTEGVLKEVNKTAEKSGTIFDKIKNTIVGFSDTIKNKFIDLTNTFSKSSKAQVVGNWFQSIISSIRGLKASNVILAIFSLKIIEMAWNTNTLITSLTGLIDKLKGGFVNFFKSPLSKFAKFSAAMLEISAAIGILVYGFYKLKDVPTDKLNTITNSLLKVIGLVGGLSLLASVLTSISLTKSGSLNTFAANMIMMAGSLFVFIGALKFMETLNMDNIWKEVITLGSIMGILAGVAILLSKVAPEMTASGLFMLSFSGAIYLLVVSLNKLSKIDFTGIRQNWKELTAVILAFGAFAVMASTVGVGSIFGLLSFIFGLKFLAANLESIKSQLQGINVGDFILEFCSRLKNTLIQAVKHLESVYNSLSSIEKGVIALLSGTLFVTLTVGLASLNKIINGITRQIRKTTISILALIAGIAGLMYLVTYIAKICQDIDPGAVNKALTILGVVGGFIAALTLLSLFGVDSTSSSKKGKNRESSSKKRSDFIKQTRKMLLDMAILLAGIALFMHVVGGLTPEQFRQASSLLENVMVFMGIISVVIALISAVGDKNNAGFSTFLGIIILLGTLLAAFIVLMNYFKDFSFEKDWQKLVASLGVIIVVAIVINSILRTIGRMGKGGTGPLLSLLGIIVVLGLIIAGFVYLAKTSGWEDLGKAGAMLLALLASIGIVYAVIKGLMKVMNDSNAGTVLKLAGTFATVIIAIGLLAVGVVAIAHFVPESELITAGIVLGALLGTLLILSLIIWRLTKYFDGVNWGTIGKVAVGIGFLTLVMYAITKIVRIVPESELQSAGLVLLGLMVAVGLLSFFLVKLTDMMDDVNWGTIGKVAVGMAIMVVVMYAIVGALYIINKLGESAKDVFWKMTAISAIILELIALAFLVVVLGKIIEKDIKGSIIGGVGLVVMVAIFYALVKICQLIDGLSYDNHIFAKTQGLVLLMTELIVLMAVVGLLGIVIGALLATGIGAVIVAGMALAMVMLYAMVKIFGALAEVCQVIDGLSYDDHIFAKCQGLVLLMLELELLAALSIVAIPAAIGQFGLRPMIEMLGELAEICATINEIPIDESVLDKVRIINTVMFQLELLGLASILAAGAYVGGEGLATMIGCFGQLAELIERINSMAIGPDVLEKIDIIKKTIWSLVGIGAVTGIFSFIGPGLTSLAEGIYSLVQACAGAGATLTDFSTGINNLTEALNALSQVDVGMDAIIAAIVTSLIAGKGQINSASAELGNEVKAGIDSSTKDADKWGIHLVENFASGIKTGYQSGGLIGALQGFGKTIKDYIGHTNPIAGFLAGKVEELWGEHMVQNFSNGITNGTASSLIPAVTGMGKNVIGTLQADLPKYLEMGKEAVGQLISGLHSGDPDAISWAEGMINLVLGVGKSVEQISSSWAKGSGTLSDFHYQLTTDISREEKRVNSLQNAYERLGDKSSSAAKKLKDQIDKGKSGISDLNDKLNNIGKAKKNIDDLGFSFDGLADSIGGGKGGGGGGGAVGALQDFETELGNVLEGQMNIFQKFEEKAAMSKTELLENMRSQIQGMTNWANNMQVLAAKGIDQGLYEELAMMGPQGAEYVGAFVDMTAEELAQANMLWAQSLVLPKQVAKNVSASFNSIGQNLMAGEAAGIAAGKGEAITESVLAQNEITEASKAAMGVQSPSTVFAAIGGFLMIGLYRGIHDNTRLPFNEMTKICHEIVNKAKDTLNTDTLYSVGVDLLTGLANGLSDPDAMAVIKSKLSALANMLEADERKEQESHSPSRRWARIGRDLVLGMAVGIEENTFEVIKSTEDLAEATVNSMKDTIAKIGQYLNDEVEDPVIRPVLDLSNVQAGARTLNNMFSSNQALSASASFSNLQNAQSNGQIGGTTFIQNNYSPKALSRVEIYRQTRNQFAQYREAFQ